MASPKIITDTVELAKALKGIVKSHGHAHDLAHGRRTPSLRLAVTIERSLKIPPRWWIERPKPQQLPERKAA